MYLIFGLKATDDFGWSFGRHVKVINRLQTLHINRLGSETSAPYLSR